MSDSSFAEKTEQPTPRKLEQALKRGQMARSPEVQTAFVLLGGVIAVAFAGREVWNNLAIAAAAVLGNLHNTPLSINAIQGYAVQGALLVIKCAGPIVLGAAAAGLVAGLIQNRFNAASEALNPNLNRLNPVEGFKRVFSFKSSVPTLLAVVKLAVIIALTYTEILTILHDPIFATSVGVARIAEFLAQSSLRIFLRVSLALLVVAAADYAYQWWKTQRELMMTKEEVKEEMKNSEGNPQIKAARRRRQSISKAKQLSQVPQADVIVTNPTRIAIALRYDRKTMRAPKVIAKGIRLNAARIREIAQQHQVPIVENKPLARMLFKHAKVGAEVPAEFYAAVAEVLAWVYRINRYRYYAEQNQS